MVRWTGALHEDVFVWDRAQFQPPRGVFEQLVPLPGQRYELRARHGLVYRFERPPGYTDPERVPLVEVRDRHDNRPEDIIALRERIQTGWSLLDKKHEPRRSLALLQQELHRLGHDDV